MGQWGDGMGEGAATHTFVLDDRTLRIDVAGHCSNDGLILMAKALQNSYSNPSVESVILHTHDLTGLDGDLRQGGLAFYGALEAIGSPFLVVVTQARAVRMITETLAFASRYSVSFCDSVERAEALIRDHRRRQAKG